MTDLSYSDELICKILTETQTIAMVGASPKWERPSNFVLKYMLGKDYKVIPVNPGQVGKEILKQTVYGDLDSIPGKFDMVDIFRSSAAAGPIVDKAIELKDEKGIKIIWMQLGVQNDEAAAKAKAAGLTVIMDRCPKIEYGRLFNELGWCGVNTGVISSKRPATRR
ncbi:MAG: CoA-binding protein [Rhodospirillales bacterium]|nr:CoA-binding protein [Rhodospirillales bacterium]